MQKVAVFVGGRPQRIFWGSAEDVALNVTALTGPDTESRSLDQTPFEHVLEPRMLPTLREFDLATGAGE